MISQAILVFNLLSVSAYAMDPFTIAAVGSTAVQAVDAASEASSTIDAFSELYSEIDTDASISDEGQRLIEEIQEVDSLAKEAGYTAEEIDSLGHQDRDQMRKLEGTLRAVTKAVRAGKRAFKLVSRLEKKAQMAQVESTQVEKEQLAAMYKMVRLQQEANLETTKKELRDQINKRKQIEALRGELKNKGAKVFGTTGVIAFPKSERVVETAIEAANRLRGPLSSLILAVFLARLLFYQFGFFGVKRMGDLVRDTILCSLLLMIYPEIVRAVLKITLDVAGQIGEVRLQDIRPKEINLPGLGAVATSTKLLILWGFEWLKYGAFALIDFFMNFGLAFMVMLFPLVIFASQMMNFAVAWPIFLGSFVTLALWPLFWNLVGLAASLSWGQTQHNFAESLYSVFFTILQLLSPLIGIKLLSGQGLSRAISDAAKTVVNPTSRVLDRLDSWREGKTHERDQNRSDTTKDGKNSDSNGRVLEADKSPGRFNDRQEQTTEKQVTHPVSSSANINSPSKKSFGEQNTLPTTDKDTFIRGFKGEGIPDPDYRENVTKETDL